MNILGVSAYYHDSAACLLGDGRIVAAAQEERFSRIKHDAGLPLRAVEYCLREAGIASADLDCLVFYEKPFLRFERLLETYMAFAPRGLGQFLKSMPVWLHDKLWIKDHLRRQLNFQGPLLFAEHHQSHAASAFFPSPFQEAAFLTLDGVGEWTTASYGVGTNNRIELLSELRFPHSLGLLYSSFTFHAGFKVNSGEYKLMGLAPYGEPKYVDTILEHLVDLKPDGSFRLNLEYFGYCTGLTMTNARFDRLFDGPPRHPEAPLSQREMDLACSVQVVTEEVLLRMAKHLHAVTGMTRLCLAGGVALNCVANGRLLREGPFKEVWVQPAAGDAGAALGAALVGWHHYFDQPRVADGKNDAMQGTYLGPQFGEDEIAKVLDEEGVVYRRLGDRQLVSEVAGLLSREQVVGWFQGRMEFGPRALGNRSILADARSSRMQRLVNLKVKFREGFRPFAPMVLEERASQWFDLAVPSPYMLLVAKVQADHLLSLADDDTHRAGLAKLGVSRSTIPTVTHVDNSARIQTVSSASNPLTHCLLSSFEEQTGCPVLVNTSFNVRGEPIVCTPHEAVRCFLATDIDCLAIGPYLLKKDAQPDYLMTRYPRGAKALD